MKQDHDQDETFDINVNPEDAASVADEPGDALVVREEYRDVEKNNNDNINEYEYEAGEIVSNRPSYCLLFLWFLIAAELVFKLLTSIFRLRSLLNEDECCGAIMQRLSVVVYAVATPHFLSTAAAIILMGILGCGLSPHFFLLDIPLLLVTYLEVVILILLSYQLSLVNAYVFAGLTGLRVVILQPISMMIGRKAGCMRFIVITILQWAAFAGMIYLLILFTNNGGVCYDQKTRFFRLEGCDLCGDGLPPGADGVCSSNDGERVVGTSYCSAAGGETDNVTGTDGFCFFEY